MDVKLKKCSYNEVESSIISNSVKLSSPIDSFAEMHILKSNHYLIQLGSESIGYCSIFDGKTVTQFYLDQKYRRYSQESFMAVRKTEFVSEALIPTCDEFFLSHGFDHYSKIDKQAYFFQYGQKTTIKSSIKPHYRLAELSDIDQIKENSGDFFDDTLTQQIKDGEIYIGFDDSKVITLGVYERGRILKRYVSIGMFTVPEYRQKGIGKQTLSYLIEEALRENLKPIAGCWYYNHLSKKTLESVGMISNTRYIRFKF